MNNLMLMVGRVAGLGGLLLCIVSFGARLSGTYYLGGIQVGTVLQAALAIMVAGCFCLLWSLTEGSKDRN